MTLIATTDRRKEQQERLLQAAYDLVAEVGVSGLRTRDIADRAKVNIATLHYCFAGKDALLEALFVFIRDKFRREMEERLATASTPAEKIVANTEMRMHFVRDAPTSVQVWRAFLGEAWINPLIREIVRRYQAEQRERFAAIIAEGRASGAFPNLPPDSDNAINASLLMGMFDGMLTQYAMDPNVYDLNAIAGAIYAWLGMTATSPTE